MSNMNLESMFRGIDNFKKWLVSVGVDVTPTDGCTVWTRIGYDREKQAHHIVARRDDYQIRYIANIVDGEPSTRCSVVYKGFIPVLETEFIPYGEPLITKEEKEIMKELFTK